MAKLNYWRHFNCRILPKQEEKGRGGGLSPYPRFRRIYTGEIQQEWDINPPPPLLIFYLHDMPSKIFKSQPISWFDHHHPPSLPKSKLKGMWSFALKGVCSQYSAEVIIACRFVYHACLFFFFFSFFQLPCTRDYFAHEYRTARQFHVWA